jgi:hypothetical protein
MKKSVLILAFLMCGVMAKAQRWDIGSSFQYIMPVGSMSRNIDNGFGIIVEGSRNFKAPFAVGMELGYTGYGYQKDRQRYTFDDGSVTETDVIVTNSFLNADLTGKYFLRNTKKVNPYVSGKLGYSWYRTILTIEDPDDAYSCHPLDTDILAKDGTFTASIGGGVRVDFSSIFRKSSPNTVFFDLSVHMTQGGTVQYMNADHHGHHTPDSDVTARFINTQSQVIHEHHVGYLYSSLVEMMQYRLGVVFRPMGWMEAD